MKTDKPTDYLLSIGQLEVFVQVEHNRQISKQQMLRFGFTHDGFSQEKREIFVSSKTI